MLQEGRARRRRGRANGDVGSDEDFPDDGDSAGSGVEDDEEGDEDALRKLGVSGHRRPGVRRGQVKSGAMSGGPKKVKFCFDILKEFFLYSYLTIKLNMIANFYLLFPYTRVKGVLRKAFSGQKWYEYYFVIKAK